MAATILQIVLLLWFFGCIRTYRIGRHLLVEGEGIKSPEFGMLCAYTIGVILFHVYHPVGKWFLLTVLLFWAVVQFFCHWYYTIFGASTKKIRGYNKCFKDTIRLLPMSECRLVPDLYHILLHILIIANIALTLI